MTINYISNFSVWLGFFMSLFGAEDASNTPDPSVQEPVIVQEINPVKEAFIADFDAEAKKLLRRINQPGAAIAIVMDSTIVYTQGFGYRNRKTKELVNENSVFRIGSLSKGFASVLTGVLVDEQSMDWEDKVHHTYLVSRLVILPLPKESKCNTYFRIRVVYHTMHIQIC